MCDSFRISKEIVTSYLNRTRNGPELIKISVRASCLKLIMKIGYIAKCCLFSVGHAESLLALDHVVLSSQVPIHKEDVIFRYTCSFQSKTRE